MDTRTRIDELDGELTTIIDNSPEKPTCTDRARLMRIQKQIKALADQKLSTKDDDDLTKLYVLVTKGIKHQEVFFRNNGNKWSAKVV